MLWCRAADRTAICIEPWPPSLPLLHFIPLLDYPSIQSILLPLRLNPVIQHSTQPQLLRSLASALAVSLLNAPSQLPLHPIPVQLPHQSFHPCLTIPVAATVVPVAVAVVMTLPRRPTSDLCRSMLLRSTRIHSCRSFVRVV